MLLLILLPCNALQCPSACHSCASPSSYTCTACNPGHNLYLSSCPASAESSPFLLFFAISVLCLHLFLLATGIGVYSNCFRCLQLAALLTWSSPTVLQVTNLAIPYNNSFMVTVGPQFLCCLILLLGFWFLLICLERVPHSPTAILLRRKRVTFPYRITTLIFNVVLFAGLAQMLALSYEQQQTVGSVGLAVIGLGGCLVTVLAYGAVCNIKKFKMDDPNYYVLTEKLSSARPLSKNNTFVSIVHSTLMVMVFCIGFSRPAFSSIFLIVLQCLYTLYGLLALNWVKFRHKLLNTAASLALLGCLVCQAGYTSASGDRWRDAHDGLLLGLCVMVMVGEGVEIVAQRFYLCRLIKSYVDRFVCCKRVDEGVQLNKYDGGVEREKVG